jgi:2-oxoglutarate dehydrogenase E1 component
MQVVQPTTPAQIFHLLRRQMIRLFRKPLIIMTPKSLLRHKDAVSPLSELAKGSFQPVIGETDGGSTRRRSSACWPARARSTTTWSRTAAKRRRTTSRSSASNSCIRSRTRQFAAELKKYEHATEVVWCQDEPQNQGAWFFVQHHIQENMTKGRSWLRGRPARPRRRWATTRSTTSSRRRCSKVRSAAQGLRREIIDVSETGTRGAPLVRARARLAERVARTSSPR